MVVVFNGFAGVVVLAKLGLTGVVVGVAVPGVVVAAANQHNEIVHSDATS